MCAGSRSHVEHHGSEGGWRQSPAPITTSKALLARPIYLAHPPGSQGYTGLPCTCSYLPNLPPPLGPVSLNDLCRLSPGAATLRNQPWLAYHLPPVQKGISPRPQRPSACSTWHLVYVEPPSDSQTGNQGSLRNLPPKDA